MSKIMTRSEVSKPSLPLAEILTLLREELSHLLGKRLEAVYLFGSYARGDARPDSDIDILIVIRGDFDYFSLIELTSPLTADISLRYDTVISCVFVSQDDYLRRRTPLLMNIRKEGVLV